MGRRLFYTFFISMAALEFFSFQLIYQANLHLKKSLMPLHASGKTIVPNHHILSTLDHPWPAFCGSLFLLLTAGVLVSFFLCLLVWLLKPAGNKQPTGDCVYPAAALISLIGIGLMLFFFADQSIFHRIRDAALLTHSVGMAINHFYYTYSPYATHAITAQIHSPYEGYIVSLCLAGLFAGLPALLFFLLFSFFSFLFKWILSRKTALILSGVMMLVLSAGSLMWLYPPTPSSTEAFTDQWQAADHSRKKIELLRNRYTRRNVQDTDLHLFADAVATASIAERYWIAKVLSRSSSKPGNHILKHLLTDDAIVVAAAAAKSLAARSSCEPETMAALYALINDHPSWYVQICAENAIKRCL